MNSTINNSKYDKLSKLLLGKINYHTQISAILTFLFISIIPSIIISILLYFMENPHWWLIFIFVFSSLIIYFSFIYLRSKIVATIFFTSENKKDFDFLFDKLKQSKIILIKDKEKYFKILESLDYDEDKEKSAKILKYERMSLYIVKPKIK